jgi:hypothetical protein
MSNILKVGWTPFVHNEGNSSESFGYFSEWQHVAIQPPEPAYKSIAGDRPNSDILPCPGITGYFKNTFLIRSPIDITITVKADIKAVTLEGAGYDQKFYKEWVVKRPNDFADPNRPIVTLGPKLVFVADEDVILEALPAMMHDSPALRNIHVIPGTYNIHRWMRPVDFTFEVLDPTQPLVFKRGDPLFYIRFIDPKDRKIELERIEQDNELLKTMYGMVVLKNYVKNVKLNKLYEMAHDWIKDKKWLPGNKKSRCPFHWGKK